MGQWRGPLWTLRQGPALRLPHASLSFGFSFLIGVLWELGRTPKAQTSSSMHPFLFGGLVDKTQNYVVSFIWFLKRTSLIDYQK